MSHNPENKDCPRHGQYAAKSECTCPPPAVDTTTAEYHLRTHQKQLDEDGIIVGVSRQAIDEVLAELDKARAEIAHGRRANEAAKVEIKRLEKGCWAENREILAELEAIKKDKTL
jgi:predicted TIM-barrel fold metal-dependent hydrolase